LRCPGIDALPALGNCAGEKDPLGQGRGLPVGDDHVGLAPLDERAQVHVHEVLSLESSEQNS